ncbi:MAG: (Fe-S)-binding protein [Proteobacteria bacterium]|jgi:Fe-S oxidoreductase|nr:(Fe-S)-binding protein [Pseudomonadota bacterium]
MADPKPDELTYYKQNDLWQVDFTPPRTGWIDTPTVMRPGSYIYPGKAKYLKELGIPNPREWEVTAEDWELPENWKEIVIKTFKDCLERSRALQIFMDTCVRCGACADKCHFFIGGGDPKNMPVLRAELLRSVYRGEFTLAGKVLGKLMGKPLGVRPLTIDVIKDWFYYFYQCTECRRCSVFCPYGIDTAEITMAGREILVNLGITVNWVIEPVGKCFRTGNHLGILPHGLKDTLEFFAEDIEEITGIAIEPPINKKGADILFVTPSGDFLADPGTFTCMGYMMLFHELGLNYTWSTYASEGGNFGLFTSKEMLKRLNAKIYAEARRLGVKWILGGECGHMWRVVHQYMDTMNGPADFLEVPKSPITGTVFNHAASTKMIHISEFTADLLKHKKLNLDPSRNDHLRVTFHDSCNTARGMGILEEPRYVIKNACNHFFEMPENTIREKTFCCGGGAGLGTDENMEMRLRGGLPRGSAVQHVRDKFGVNTLAAICAIDRATLSTLCEYWAPEVEVTGITEMLANAMVMKGECERELNLRMEELADLQEEG